MYEAAFLIKYLNDWLYIMIPAEDRKILLDCDTGPGSSQTDWGGLPRGWMSSGEDYWRLERRLLSPHRAS